MGPRAAAIVFVAAFAGLAAPAFGGTVSERRGDLVYTAAPGESNELSIMLQGGEFTIQDGSLGNRDTLYVTAEPPCRHDETPQPSTGMIDAYCPSAGVTRIVVDAGDGNDYVGIGAMTATDYPSVIDAGDGADRVWAGSQSDVVHGGLGNDDITGNAGRDELFGEAGDDVIDAADGVPDKVSCGEGYDTVKADAVDTVAADCENVSVNGGAPVRSQPFTMEMQPTRSEARKGVRFRVSCPATCDVRSWLLAGGRVLATGRAHRDGAGMVTVRTRPLSRATQRGRPLRLRVTVCTCNYP